MTYHLSFNQRFFEILAKAYLDSFNGTLSASRGDTRKSVSLMFGKIISASSNAKIDRLELWFYKKKFLSKDEIAKFSQLARKKKISFWKAIVLSKRFSDQQLSELITERIVEILYDLFTWTEGTVEVLEGEYTGGDLPNMEMDTPGITKAILMRLPPEELVSFLKSKGNMIVASQEVEIEPGKEEKELLKKVEHPRSIDLILSSFPPYLVTYLYIFGAITIKEVELPGEAAEEEPSTLEAKPPELEAKELFEKGMEKYREGDYSSALILFREAVKTSPHPDYYTALGLTYATEWEGHEPEIKKAASSFRKALELDPRNPRNYFYLGEILKHVGRVEEAKKYFRKALKLNPEYQPAKKELENLK